MQDLMVFEGKKVEVFELNGQVLFNPYHVGGCLGLDEVTVRRHIQSMNFQQVVKLKNPDVQTMNIRKLNNAGENFLTESGVYKLIFKSRKPNAEKFQDWVTDEVLPSIRKTGSYAGIIQKPTTKDSIKALAILEKAFRSAYKIAKIALPDRNQAVLKADIAARKLTGQSPLTLLGIELKSPSQKRLLTQ